MSINYYARVIPSKEKVEDLKKLIDSNDFDRIKYVSDAMYGSFRPYKMEDEIQGEIHLGKCSGGWKFLWNPNIYQIRHGHCEEYEREDGSKYCKWIVDPDTAYYTYPLTKEGIKAFIDREDIEIYDEYGKKQDKEEFFKEALAWTTWRGSEAFDADSYHKAHPEEREWLYTSEYTEFLESLGYKLSKDKSDFYSDGLRFSTSTEFS